MANKKNLANGFVAADVGTSATTLVLQAGYGATMPTVPFYATATPPGQLSTFGNSEIVKVTARSTETLTIDRAQLGTTAQDIRAGWVLGNGIYVEDLNFNSTTLGEVPTGSVNGSNTAFATAVPYIGGSLQLYVNGLRQKPTTHYTESSPSTGAFTLSDAPLTGDVVTVDYLFASGSSSANSDTVDGYHAAATPTANMIPVLDSNGKLIQSTVPGVAFKARRNTSQSSTASASISFIPNALYYNFGGGYDIATGLFTAPIDGVYSFKGSAYSETTPTTRTFFESRGTANTGNAPAGLARGTERSNDFDSANLRRTVGIFEVYMYAGETFGLTLYNSHSNALSNLSTWFSGHLVMAA